MELFEKEHVLDNVREISAYLEEKLDEVAASCEDIETRRGSGLMQGLVFKKPVGEIITRALDHGLILINAGTNIIRFVPPLIISRQDVDDMIAILKECIS